VGPRDPVGLPSISTAFFFIQWGGRIKKRQGRMLDGKAWDEFPAALA
jgi:protein gp37